MANIQNEIENFFSKKKLTKTQKEVLERFQKYLKRLDRTQKTQITYVRSVWQFVHANGWDFERDLTDADFETWLDWLFENIDSPYTRNFRKQILKRFLRWHYKTKHLPDWMDFLFEKEEVEDRGTEIILAPGTIQQLIESCYGITTTRDQAIIALQYDTGARINEVLKCTIGSFEFYADEKQTGKVDMPNSKKLKRKEPTRPIPLTFSVPYLKKLIESLDTRNPKNPIFQGMNPPNVGGQLGYEGWRYQFREIIKRAGPLKDINGNIMERDTPTHALRHTRLTELAQDGFDELNLCLRAGWMANSPMVRKYIHPTQKQKENRQRRAQGLEIEGEPQRQISELETIVCPFCGEINPANIYFCINRECHKRIHRKDELENLREENKALHQRIAELEKAKEQEKARDEEIASLSPEALLKQFSEALKWAEKEGKLPEIFKNIPNISSLPVEEE